MRTISRLLGTAAAAGTMLVLAALPASATPAQGVYPGTGLGATVPIATQSALNHALAKARAAGFVNSQCAPVGDPSASFDGELWTADWEVLCTS
ncbi:hypothetical protein [Kitasatospora viridis]|uniref:PASTA domain-containing protein n=1 Tax=Kitasatospora viridis TaxID=281105 RepID=A0A561T705_9ACTN|nr:hypothetical protein [Kitasatospora viridis]TWF82880.1 hypothetical protein FHX73_14362 [Kitasatospora viridis]